MSEDTNLSPRRRRLTRVVLGVGTLFGLGYLAYTLFADPAALGINFDVYRGAVANLWAGNAIYGHSPVADPAFTYRYPPILLVWFSVYLLVSPLVGYLLHVVGTLLVGVVLGRVVYRATEQHGVALTTVDRLLVIGFVTVGSYVAPSLAYGNINHHIGLAMAAGLVWLSANQQLRAGATLALSALPKVFPAAIGVWLLRQRAWRAIAAALATGIGALAAGAVLFDPSRTYRYVTTELLPRASSGSFSGGLPASSELVSLRRPLSVVFPSASESVLALLALGIVAPIVAYCYREQVGSRGRLVSLFVTLAGLLIVLPSFSLYWSILVYPLVALLYVLDSPAGELFVVGALVSTLTLKYPDVVFLARSVPLPDSLRRGLLAGVETVYTIATPVLWGTAAMIVACLWWLRTQ